MNDAKVIPMQLEGDTDRQRMCEREVVRLLLNYPAQPLNEGTTTVTHYLLSETDETPFHTPEYANLRKWCADEVAAGRYPDVRALYQIESTSLRRTLGDLVTEIDQLSPDWITRQVYVPHELNQLQTACENAILRLNKCTVERELDECLASMQATDPAKIDEYLSHLAIYKSLKQLDMQLTQLLGLHLDEVEPVVPPTPGEQAMKELDALIAEVVAAVEPFRATRQRGHQDVNQLLADHEARPAIVAQVQAADALMRRMHGRYHHYIQQHQTLGRLLDRGSEVEQDALRRHYEPTKVAMRLRSLRMLCGELMIDFRCIVDFMPEAFVLDYFKDCHLSK
jgi:hypothetical protein